jgi:RND family efflux transporter MFP subunit
MVDNENLHKLLRYKHYIVHAVLSLLLVGGGVIGLTALTYSKSDIEKAESLVTPALVRSLTVHTGHETIQIKGEGTVRPVSEINLAAQVQGEVVYVSQSLTNGGRFNKGDVLARIDPIDYKLQVTCARAAVKEAYSRLMTAQAESETAKKEWYAINGNSAIPVLAAKTPQLAAAKSAFEAAEADLAKAELALKRTRIKAPFKGRVSKKYVDIGQHLSTGQILADIFCTDAAEIIVPLADKELRWFHVPGFTPGNDKGAKTLVNAQITGRSVEWEGRVVRSEGKLDLKTRMVNVVIRVDKPYAKKPPLVPGLYVTVQIQGQCLDDAVIVPRSALRSDGNVWVVDADDTLRFRNVKVGRIQDDVAIVLEGLQDGEQVVVSALKAVTDGMKVRVGRISGPDTPIRKGRS